MKAFFIVTLLLWWSELTERGDRLRSLLGSGPSWPGTSRTIKPVPAGCCVSVGAAGLCCCPRCSSPGQGWWEDLHPTILLHISWWHTKWRLKARNSLLFLMLWYEKDFSSPLKERKLIGIIKNYWFNTKVLYYSKLVVLSTKSLYPLSVVFVFVLHLHKVYWQSMSFLLHIYVFHGWAHLWNCLDINKTIAIQKLSSHHGFLSSYLWILRFNYS